MTKWLSPFVLCAVVLFAGCSKQKTPQTVKSFSLNSLDGVIMKSGVLLDSGVSADGGGSLKIETSDPITVPIFEIADLNIENARILYQAKVKVENVIGQVYLEMLCHFPDGGEYFSRGQATLLSGTTDWTSQETPFLLQQGQKPDIIKLNLVFNGHGTVWIDDMKLMKVPL